MYRLPPRHSNTLAHFSYPSVPSFNCVMKNDGLLNSPSIFSTPILSVTEVFNRAMTTQLVRLYRQNRTPTAPARRRPTGRTEAPRRCRPRSRVAGRPLPRTAGAACRACQPRERRDDCLTPASGKSSSGTTECCDSVLGP